MKKYTFSYFFTFKWCVKFLFSADSNATGGYCSALLLAVNPAVVWNQGQGNLQRGSVANATTVGRRVSNSASTAANAQVSEHSSLTPTQHTMSFLFTINKVLDMEFWCMATQTVVHEIWSLCPATKGLVTISWRDRTRYSCKAQQRFIRQCKELWREEKSGSTRSRGNSEGVLSPQICFSVSTPVTLVI